MMTQAQAAYDLLLMLSVIDGEIEDMERTVIRHYVSRRYEEKIDFDAEDAQLAQLAPESLLDRFQAAAAAFLEQSNHNDRMELLSKAMDVVTADGVISKEEAKVFKGLADVWEIDLAPLLRF